MVRLPGICNHDEATTVLAHVRLIGISGMGTKAPDLLGAWCCSDCHYHADHVKDPDVKLAFFEGVFRTQAQLIKEGLIHVD
jgi:hypothetical protein